MDRDEEKAWQCFWRREGPCFDDHIGEEGAGDAL